MLLWRQDEERDHRELQDSCLLLSEERLPEKGVQSEDCRQGGYEGAPGSRICILYPNRTGANPPLTSS